MFFPYSPPPLIRGREKFLNQIYWGGNKLGYGASQSGKWMVGTVLLTYLRHGFNIVRFTD